MAVKTMLGVITFTQGKIEIEIPNDSDLFIELEKLTDGELTWFKHDLKILVVDSIRVVVKATDVSNELIDQYCLERR